MKRSSLKHSMAIVTWSVCLMAALLCSPAWAVGFNAPGAQHCYNHVTTGTTVACTLPGNPTTGSVITFAMNTFTGLSLSSVQDNAGSPNTYTKGCQATNDSQAGTACSGYLIAPAGAGKTVTATLSGTCGACSIEVMEFTVTGGTASFDKSDFTTGHGLDAVTLPTMTPTGTGELFFANCTDANTCTGVTGSWTACPNGLGSFSEECEYQLSVGSATAVGFSGVVGQFYDSTELSFKFTATSSTTNQFPRIIGMVAPLL